MFSDFSYFQGDFKNDLPNGFGLYRFQDGLVYEGDFV